MSTITRGNAKTTTEIAALLFAHKENFQEFMILAEKMIEFYAKKQATEFAYITFLSDTLELSRSDTPKRMMEEIYDNWRNGL